MIERVNTYLKEIIRWRPAFRSEFTPSPLQGSCCIGIHIQDIFIVKTRSVEDKIELQVCAVSSSPKGVSLETHLANLVKQYQLQGITCSWMLHPEYYQLLFMEALPVVTVAEFQSAIRWKIKDLIPFPIEDAVIDNFSLPTQRARDSRKMMTVVVARASFLERIAREIEASGMHLNAITIPELGLRNIAALYEEDEKSSALLYLQSTQIHLIITRQKNLFLSRRFEFGIDILNGCTDEASLTLQLDKLALEIQRSFDYYQTHWRNPSPLKIHWSETKATRIDISVELSRRLSLPVQGLNLSEILSIKDPALSAHLLGKCLPLVGYLLQQEIPHYATAD